MNGVSRTAFGRIHRRMVAAITGLVLGLATVLTVPALLATPAGASQIPTSLRAERAIDRKTPVLSQSLARQDLRLGAPLFIRIFKLERSLEVWMETEAGTYEKFKSYRICAYSGQLGPKEREGDLQAPEGFYSVRARDLNPESSFHLSFNIGFPNAFDRQRGATGRFLMVHGSCISKGCYAMTDPRMEEIYTLTAAAFEGGQDEIPVHIFPFRMTDANMHVSRASRWIDFWQNLRQGHDIFEETRVPPIVWAEQGRYAFFKRGRILHRGTRLAAVPAPARHPTLADARPALARATGPTAPGPRRVSSMAGPASRSAPVDFAAQAASVTGGLNRQALRVAAGIGAPVTETTAPLTPAAAPRPVPRPDGLPGGADTPAPTAPTGSISQQAPRRPAGSLEAR